VTGAILQTSRRTFCIAGVALAGHAVLGASMPLQTADYDFVARTDRRRILEAAKRYVNLEISTITSFPSSRSPGGLHDFFSQADYFWPNPANPSGPYINRDGQSNPDNFNEHRKAMIALSIQMPALCAAWMLTHDSGYTPQIIFVRGSFRPRRV
jgi:hypothetical protein